MHHGFVVFLGFRCILLDFIHILSEGKYEIGQFSSLHSDSDTMQHIVGTADIQVPAVKYLYELGIAVPVAFGFLIAETLFLAM